VKPTFESFTEPKTDRRKFLVGLLFCSAAGLAVWRTPRRHLDQLGSQKLDDLVPKAVGRWTFVTASGLVIPPDDKLSQALYSEVLTRAYSDGQGNSIMLLLAQSGGQTGFLQVHRPEVCYTAGGYQISPVMPHAIQVGQMIIPALSMDASAGGSAPEHIVYWTRIGNRMPTSWREQRLAVAEQNLEGIIPDAILVRISSVNNDGDAARATIDAFVRELLAAIPANRRAVFVASA
jgi:EpsI family protein